LIGAVIGGATASAAATVDVNVQRVLFTLNWRFGGFGETTAAAY
jgi:hypothetical protein